MELVKNENLQQIIRQIEPRFTEIASVHGAVNFQTEALFAMQLINGSDFLARAAAGAPDTLKQAVFNVAAIGLSLNPATGLAYLVPRNGKVCLDIGYRGLVHLAAEARSIMWAVAELFCEKDTYKNNGVGNRPTHEFNPFDDRGKVLGAYCVAKSFNGEYIVAEMPIKEIHAIRDRSASWKAGGHGPWKSDPNEMIKKTVIRRASKSWPRVDMSPRFAKALEVADGSDPVSFGPPPAPRVNETEQLLKDVRLHLAALNKTEPAYLEYASRQFKREVKALEELTTEELKGVETFLRGMITAQIAKAEKAEAAREKAV